ncbi:MAG: carboxypeptidase regulatory-like domain-containing protein [Planctomycetes bacterium]|nr:carboxypeptidase regulatory-like domain-containing protein [Planctomycetota bacterium]
MLLTALVISTTLAVTAKTRSVRDSEEATTAENGNESATTPKAATIAELLKDWPGSGTMNMRAAAPIVAQRQEANMMDTTIGVVLSVIREGPAKDAGLQVGDFIVRVADNEVRSNHHLIALTRAMPPGANVNVEFVRKGKKMAVDVLLDPLEWGEGYPILAGNVRLPNGQPAMGAMIYAHVYYDRGSISTGLPYLTDIQGHFIGRFSSRPDLGRCFLLATTYDDYAGYTIVDFPIEAPVDIQLTKGKITKGRLITDNGEGIPDVLLEVEGIAVPGEKLKFGMYPELRTDRKGYFNLPALPVGSRVQLNFEVAGYARPGRGPYDLTQLEEGLVFGEGGIPRGASIKGVVVISDTGESLGPFSLSWRNTSVNISGSTQVNAEGRFNVDTLPPGDTSFFISVHEMRQLGYTLTQEVGNLRPGEKVVDLRLTAEPFGVITGKVTDKTTKQGLAGFTVTAGNEAFTGDRFRTTTLADGTYRLPIPAGNVWFTFREAQNYKLRVKPGQEIDGVDFVGEAVNGLSEEKIIVRLLDLNGLPVSSVRVGKYWSNSDEIQGRPYINFNYVPSDEEGLVQFQKDDLFQDRNQNERRLLYALGPSQKLAGFTEISPQDADQVIDWQLHPACRVNGRLESSSLEKLEQNLEWTNVYVYKDNYRPLSYSSKAGQFEFLLPPGSYKLNAYGTSTYSINREIEIKRGQKELKVKLDLPADRFATLMGKTAPKFRNIKGWINTEPLKLANLRGKLVLLDFWGYWCGPCVRDMPNLMAIYDAFSDSGLIVIGIHDDSVESIDELDEKLTKVREKIWMGRELNFPIALDGGGETQVVGTDLKVRGATTAAYRISSFPTTVLIDPDGKVIGRFHAPSLDDKIAKLENLVGVKAKKPQWRVRFDAVYRLDNGELLRHIPEPYIPERDDFYFRQFTQWGWLRVYPWEHMPLPIPESAMLTWDGEKNQAKGGMDGGRKSLISLLRNLGFHEREFEGEPALLDWRVPGDWIKRENIGREQLLAAFGRILNDTDTLNLSIRFVPEEVERDAVVATGTFEFHPLGGEYGNGTIHLFVEKPDPADSIEGGGGSGDLDLFLDYIGRLGRIKIINESKISSVENLNWRQHSSAQTTHLRENPGLFQMLLGNVTKQTSLQFRRERRKERVWLVKSSSEFSNTDS